jgi:hypothetical protein
MQPAEALVEKPLPGPSRGEGGLHGQGRKPQQPDRTSYWWRPSPRRSAHHGGCRPSPSPAWWRSSGHDRRRSCQRAACGSPGRRSLIYPGTRGIAPPRPTRSPVTFPPGGGASSCPEPNRGQTRQVAGPWTHGDSTQRTLVLPGTTLVRDRLVPAPGQRPEGLCRVPAPRTGRAPRPTARLKECRGSEHSRVEMPFVEG